MIVVMKVMVMMEILVIITTLTIMALLCVNDDNNTDDNDCYYDNYNNNDLPISVYSDKHIRVGMVLCYPSVLIIVNYNFSGSYLSTAAKPFSIWQPLPPVQTIVKHEMM